MAKIKILELLSLNVCVNSILETSDSLSGLIIYDLNENILLGLEHLKKFEKTKDKLIEDLSDKDENDQLIKVDNVPQLSEENKTKLEKEVNSLLDKEITIDFVKLPKSKFVTLNFNTSKIPSMGTFINYLVDKDS